MKYLSVIIISLLFINAKAQLKVYSFTQVDSLRKVEDRPVVVFIYTDWCNYCNAMKQTTFKDKAIVKQLNDNFCFVMLNAENKEEIIYRNKRFPYNASQGLNDLVIEFGRNGKIAYPAIVMLDVKNEIVFQTSQFLNSKQLTKLLNQLPHN